jgi:hypothetical protein
VSPAVGRARAQLAELLRRPGATLADYAAAKLALLDAIEATPPADVIPIGRAEPEAIRGGGEQLLG